MRQASHLLWGSAGSKMPIHSQFSLLAILISKLSQTDLVFGVLSGLMMMMMKLPILPVRWKTRASFVYRTKNMR